MKRTLLVLPLCLLSFVVGLRVSGQQTANIAKPSSVKQGSTLPFQLTTDRASSVEGSVDIEVMPEDGTQPTRSSGYALQGQTIKGGVIIPFDGKLGKWKVTKATFSTANGITKLLTLKGDLTFVVTPHEEVSLPSDATVKIEQGK